MQQAIFFTLLQLVLLHVQTGRSVQVSCLDQSVFCECPDDAEQCEFDFRVSQRFSFVSYSLNQTSRQLSDTGSTYFLNETGYHHSSGSECNLDDTTRITSGEDFTTMDCSIPMTLDGVNYRSMLLINGRIPGPTLVVYEGQIIVVHVFNQLETVGITIHWHGLFQKGTSWMDGVGFVSQAPIDAGAQFDYIFKAEPSGTHWYHSHIGAQKSDGLFGGLVIRERQSLGDILGNDMYDSVIEEPGLHTMTLIDWQRTPTFIDQSLAGLGFYTEIPIGQVPTDSDQIFEGQNSIDGSFLGGIEFWSGLINGMGRLNSSVLTPLSVFRVQRDQTYHFRMVGSISIYALKLSIDGHRLIAIASDGRYFQPTVVDYIIIHTGETYDFLLETNNVDNTNFWIRAETLAINLPQGAEQSARAILTYGDSTDLDWTNGYSNVVDMPPNCTPDSFCEVLNCPFENYPPDTNLNCVPLTSLTGKTGTPESERPRFPPDASCSDCTQFLNFAFQGGPLNDSSVNANSFVFPPLAFATNCFEYSDLKNDPTSNACSNCEVDQTSLNGGCQCIHVVPIANEEIYDPNSEMPSVVMVLSSMGADFAHPIHLHGHTFFVVDIGYGEYNETTGRLIGDSGAIDCGSDRYCTNPMWTNGMPPQSVFDRIVDGRVSNTTIRKDTIMIPPGGYVVIALQADNPGYWIMHCHIEEHLLNGMAIVVQEYNGAQQWWPPPGINLHGSFSWTVEDFNTTVSQGVTCGSPPMPPPTQPVVPTDAGEIIVSRAGFGVAIALIIVLFLLVVGLVVAIIVICLRGKKVESPQVRSAPKEEISMTEVRT